MKKYNGLPQHSMYFIPLNALNCECKQGFESLKGLRRSHVNHRCCNQQIIVFTHLLSLFLRLPRAVRHPKYLAESRHWRVGHAICAVVFPSLFVRPPAFVLETPCALVFENGDCQIRPLKQKCKKHDSFVRRLKRLRMIKKIKNILPYIAITRREFCKGRFPSRPNQVNDGAIESFNPSFKHRFTASFRLKPPMSWK